ncbi:MAG: DUF4421 domain-containing protein [Prevotella sp.]|nr:DUF4421 domain-containing protein [Prevotella sp.]
MRLPYVLTMLVFAVMDGPAQTKPQQLKARMDSVLESRYHRANYDTNYIRRPDSRLTVKLRANLSGNAIYSRGAIEGIATKADLKTAYRATMSVGFSYMGVSAGLAINPASLKGRNKDYELNINLFSRRFSLDMAYQNSKTLSGDIHADDLVMEVEKGFVELHTINLTGYYIFNHRRFSYPAAFTQSYIQRRSAGSWLLGFSFQGSSAKTDAVEDDGFADAIFPETRIYSGHFGIGGGYAHNFVFGRKWLLHYTIMPTLALINRSNITLDGLREHMHTRFPDMIFNERVAVVRNFSDKYFAGATLIMSNTLFHDNDMRINQNKWRLRAFFGIRFK